jgi:tripartite-type tricarboxylate transporter receptor subunit TctC
LLAAGALMPLGSAPSQAQDFPNRAIRIVVPSPAGGGTDIAARHIAQRLTVKLNQPVFVENRTGAGSLVGTDFVAKAPGDGYTLLMGGLFNMAMNSALIKPVLRSGPRLHGGRLHLGLSVHSAGA